MHLAPQEIPEFIPTTNMGKNENFRASFWENKTQMQITCFRKKCNKKNVTKKVLQVQK